jgi:hypothetical protein
MRRDFAQHNILNRSELRQITKRGVSFQLLQRFPQVVVVDKQALKSDNTALLKLERGKDNKPKASTKPRSDSFRSAISQQRQF